MLHKITYFCQEKTDALRLYGEELSLLEMTMGTRLGTDKPVQNKATRMMITLDCIDIG